MTTTPPRHRTPGTSPAGGASERVRTAPNAMLLAPVAAAFATIGAATSLTGVIAGTAWLGYVAVAGVLVACTGLALRSVRTPAPLVPPVQLLVLLALVTGAFTRSGILAVVPGPATFGELGTVLTSAFEQIRTSVPPVEGTAPILCLATIAIGLVAVVVDTLAVAASVPAATGLILLCVYAVPSALADELLPWWTFALGAVGFASLLAIDGSHRNRRWRNRSTPGAGPSPATASAPLAVVAAALVTGLVAGSTVTSIGTKGSLPGSTSGGPSVQGGLGVNPFTSLRGMLNRGGDVELFRVRGLGDGERLLRAFTLDTYRPNQGWGLPDGPMPAGVSAAGPLPRAPGDEGTGPTRTIRIDPVNWNDVWLPVYGAPRELRGISAGWYYDHTSGSVFRERRATPEPYVEIASLGRPTRQELRAAGPVTGAVPPVYTDAKGVDPRVTELTRRLTASKDTTFDKVEAVWRYFDAGNGFVYDTETAPATDSNALADFLLKGKRGYCEQFASSMAVMLRTLDIPARVAVGFTSGYRDGAVRTVTSRDAHAWVEVYFDGHGWVSFDPTPLADGRGTIPPYLQSEADAGAPSTEPESETSTKPETTSPRSSDPTDDARAAGAGTGSQPGSPGWLGWAALAAALGALALPVVLWLTARRSRDEHGVAGAGQKWGPLAAALAWVVATVLVGWWLHWAVAVLLLVAAAVVAAPSAVRRVQRARSLREVAEGVPGAADTAWRELIQECADRGLDISATDTVRLAAQKIAQRNRLDERGRTALRTLVTGIEHARYSSQRTSTATFAEGFHGVLHGLERTAPLPWYSRLWPRSILRRGIRR